MRYALAALLLLLTGCTPGERQFIVYQAFGIPKPYYAQPSYATTQQEPVRPIPLSDDTELEALMDASRSNQAAPTTHGVADFPRLRREFSVSSGRFAEQHAGKTRFEATGAFVGVERMPVPTETAPYFARVRVDGPVLREVLCLGFQSPPSGIAAIRVGTRVRISGLVGMPLEREMILGYRGCRIEP